MTAPHLVIVSRSMPPDSGGYQRQISLLAPHLEGHFKSIGWIGAVRDQPPAGRLHVEGVDRWTRVPAWRLTRAFRGGADYVVVVLALARVLGLLVRRQAVVVLLLSPAMFGSVWFARAMSVLRVRIVARYPAPGDAMRNRGRRVGQSNNVTSVAPSPGQVDAECGFTIRLLPNAVERGRAITADKQDGGTFLYVGRLIDTKRVDLLVDAWLSIHAALPAWELVIVGDGGSERNSQEASIRQRVDDETAVRCHLIGRVESAWSYFASADVFVFPSEREGLPNAMLEAMAWGLPVIADPARVVEWFPTVPPLLDWPRAPRALGDAMLQAATDTEARRRVAEAGTMFVWEHHSPERAADLLRLAMAVR